MLITRRSQFSGKVNTMDINITQKQYDDFLQDTRPIQKIFPFLCPDEREFLITGCTPQEWKEMFGK